MSENQLQVREEVSLQEARSTATDIFNPVVWQQMKGMATAFAASGALPRDMNSSKLVLLIQAGYEMGMKPVESIKSFYFVNGILTIFGAATIRRLREHGWRIKYEESDADGGSITATVTKRHSADDIEEYTDTFSYTDAELSGWTKGSKPGWLPGANRKNKLRYGVISKIIKTYIPEVLGSVVDITEVAEDATIVAVKGGRISNLPDPKAKVAESFTEGKDVVDGENVPEVESVTVPENPDAKADAAAEAPAPEVVEADSTGNNDEPKLDLNSDVSAVLAKAGAKKEAK